MKKHLPWWAVLAGGTLAILLTGFIFSLFGIAGAQDVPSETGRLLLRILLLSPLLETFVGQLLPIETCKTGNGVLFNKELPVLEATVSAAMFGLLHMYSPMFYLYGFIAGLVLAFSYLYFKKEKSWWLAFIMTALMHMLANLLSFVINTL